MTASECRTCHPHSLGLTSPCDDREGDVLRLQGTLEKHAVAMGWRARVPLEELVDRHQSCGAKCPCDSGAVGAHFHYRAVVTWTRNTVGVMTVARFRCRPRPRPDELNLVGRTDGHMTSSLPGCATAGRSAGKGTADLRPPVQAHPPQAACPDRPPLAVSARVERMRRRRLSPGQGVEQAVSKESR